MPTELIFPVPLHKFMDFAFMVGDEYYNVEFQAGKINRKDYRRFSIYHTLLSDKYNVDNVSSIIICTEEIDKKTFYKTNSISFKPILISLKDYDGDKFLNSIRDKIENNKEITMEEAYHLAYLPFYKNKMEAKEVLGEVLLLTNKIKGITQEEKDILKSGQTIAIDQFIKNPKEKKEFIEVLKMESETLNIIKKEGIQEGIEQGIQEGREQGIFGVAEKMVKSKMPVSKIMEFTGLSKEQIENIK